MAKERILVVEDEDDIRELIELHLRRESYVVETVENGELALQKLQGETYALLIVDWMLPGMSGLEIIRNLSNRIPILMLTARVEPADVIVGLEAGADDYVTKPFDVPVLMARVRALLRRAALSSKETTSTASNPEIVMGDLRINTESYDVRCQGVPINLTPSEFKLLHTLIQNRGRVLTRERLIEAVQGEGVTVIDRAIDTHVFGLRKKLGACSEWIDTVRGVGYRVKVELGGASS